MSEINIHVDPATGEEYTTTMVLGAPVRHRIAPPDGGRVAGHDLSRFRAAAHHAKVVLPGAVGEFISRELDAHAEFGWRFQQGAPIERLAREVLAMRRQ